jgi:hypothetical protein
VCVVGCLIQLAAASMLIAVWCGFLDTECKIGQARAAPWLARQPCRSQLAS